MDRCADPCRPGTGCLRQPAGGRQAAAGYRSGIRPALVGEAAHPARADFPCCRPRSSCCARWSGSSPRSRSCLTRRRSVVGSPHSTSRSPRSTRPRWRGRRRPRRAGRRSGRGAVAADPLRYAAVAAPQGAAEGPARAGGASRQRRSQRQIAVVRRGDKTASGHRNIDAVCRALVSAYGG